MRTTPSKTLFFIVAFAASTLLAGAAFADVAPPNTADCTFTKSVGNSCVRETGEPGSCVKSICQKLDYSKMPPVLGPYDCLLCEAHDAGPAKPADSTPATPQSADAGTTATAAPESSSKSGGCSVTSTASGFAPLALALSIPLLVRRRRRA